MHTAILALGSNVGDRAQYIETAIRLLSQQMKIVAVAGLYESKAAGVPDQPDFLNTAAVVETELSPHEVLACIKEIEKETGRIDRFHWGPREIDIDIISYDDLVYRDETLEIPHPHAAERDFVLTPLDEIAPEWHHPSLKKTAKELIAELPSRMVLSRHEKPIIF